MTKEVKVFFCGEPAKIEAGLVVGQQLIALAELNGSGQLLLERDDDIDIPVEATDLVVIDGGERFSVGGGDPPIVSNPKLRRPIRFVLNGERIEGDRALQMAKLSGVELKGLDVNSDPGDGLFAELKDLADEPIGDDATILVQDKDRFITTPPGNVGEVAHKRDLFDFHLDEAQAAYGPLSVQRDTQDAFVVREALELPTHWQPNQVDLLIHVRDGYPITPLDMFFVYPPLQLVGGGEPANAGTGYGFFGRVWQRFSWHYARAWNPNRDTLKSHIRFCLARLQRKE